MEFWGLCAIGLGCGFKGFAGTRTNLTATALQVLSQKTLCPGLLPASDHPYPNASSRHWTNTCPGATALELQFDARTKLEWFYDEIQITDADGVHVADSPFTGDQLSGKTVIVPGDTVILQLAADGAISDWGFQVSAIHALEPASNPVVFSREPVALLWRVEHRGGGPAMVAEFPWLDRVHLSTEPTLNATALPVAAHSLDRALFREQYYSQLRTISIPAALFGDYYLILLADARNDLMETNENDNEIFLRLRIEDTDLAAVDVTVPPVAAPQEPISINFTAANLSSNIAYPHWVDLIYLRQGGSNLLDFIVRDRPLLSGEVYNVTRGVTLPPMPAGVHRLELHVNQTGVLETNRVNNVVGASISIIPPDIVALTASGPGVVVAGEWHSASFVVSNASSVPAYPPWSDVLYVSSTNVWTPAALRVGKASRIHPLHHGNSYTQSLSLSFPAVLTGNRFLLFRTDAGTNLFDVNLNNNVLALPVLVTAPDLAVTSFDAGPNLEVSPNQPLTLTWAVEHQGPSPPCDAWLDRVVVASDAQGTNIVAVAYSFLSPSPTASYSRTAEVRAPAVPPGNYYFILQIDAADCQPELNEHNNALSIPITIAPSGLIVETVTAPAVVAAQQYFEVAWTVRNLGLTTAYPPWHDSIAIAPTNDPSRPWAHLLHFSREEALAPGAAYTQTQSVILSSFLPGNYLLVADTSYMADFDANRIAVTPVTLRGADLVPLGITTPSAARLQSNGQAVVQVLNLGPAMAVPPWRVDFYTSPTNFWVPDASYVGSGDALHPVAPGASTFVTADLRYLHSPGQDFLVAVIEPAQVSDPEPDNNQVFTRVFIYGPDLAPQSLGVPGVEPPTDIVVAAQQTFDVQWVTRNWDAGPTMRDWRDVIMLISTRGLPQIHEIGSAHRTHLLLPDESYIGRASVTLPPVKPGRHELMVRVDGRFELEETSELNNTEIIGIEVVSPNLAVLDLQSQVIVDGQSTCAVTWRVQNIGQVNAFPPWTDRLYLSPTNRVTADSLEVASVSRSLAVPIGNIYAVTQLATLPSVNLSEYYLVVRTDDDSRLFDSLPDDNEFALPISILKPDLSPIAFFPAVQDGLLAVPPQSTVPLYYEVENLGPGSAIPAWHDRVYFSSDDVIDAEDIIVDERGNLTSSVAAGGIYTNAMSVRVPAVAPGNHFLILQVNDASNVAEASFSNNTFAIPISIAAFDLEVLAVLSTNEAAPNQVIPIAWTVRNNGPAAAFPAWRDVFYLSTEPARNANAKFLGAFSRNDSLGLGDSYTGNASLLVHGVPSGNYYLIAETGAGLFDSAPANNARAFPLRIVLPDLVPLRLTALQVSGACPGPFPETTTAVPRGALLRWTNDCPGASNLQMTFSADSHIAANISFLSIEDKHGVPISGSPFTGSLNLTKVVPGDAAILELRAGLVGQDYFRITDMTPVTAATNLLASPQGHLDIEWLVKNAGPGLAAPLWAGQFYLSTDSILDSSDGALEGLQVDYTLPAGAESRERLRLGIGSIPPGEYRLLLNLDDFHYLQETSENNNVLSTPITIGQPADLRPVFLTAPASITSTERSSVVGLSWRMTNQGAASAVSQWVDNLYLSRDLSIDATDQLLVSVPHAGLIEAGGVYTVTQNVTLPIPESGLYYLLLLADGPGACEDGCVYEASETNNTLSVSIQVDLTLPDLVVTDLIAPSLLVSAMESCPLEFQWIVRNQGSSTAFGPWFDGVYINGERVSMTHREGPLAPGQSYTNQRLEYLTAPFSSEYAIAVRTDDPSQCICVPEETESNNSITRTVKFTRSPREILTAGELSSVPLRIKTSTQVDWVEFTLHAPPDRVTDLAPGSGIAFVTMISHGHGQYQVTLQPIIGQYFWGDRLVARLHFRALPVQTSTFVSFAVSNVLALSIDGPYVSTVSVQAGRAVIIGSQPLLDATPGAISHHLLTLYGLPGSTIVLEGKEAFDSTSWIDVWQGTLTNRFQHLGPYPVSGNTRFYRARYQPF